MVIDPVSTLIDPASKDTLVCLLDHDIENGLVAAGGLVTVG